MNLQVLISTMYQKNLSFLQDMNLQSDAIIINQNLDDINQNLDDCSIEIKQIEGKTIKLVNSLDKGLSKSRNLAIQHSEADICLIADDDIFYKDDYVEKVKRAYSKYPEADIIAFQVERVNTTSRGKQFRKKASWENYLTSMKISSVEISFKRKSIVDNNITFNTNFGAGSNFSHGEENIFLYDCLKNGLKILYLPICIGAVDSSESSWFKGYDKSYFYTIGAKFYNMTPTYYHALILQFALRKRKLYAKRFSFKKVVELMYDGVKLYKEKHGEK